MANPHLITPRPDTSPSEADTPEARMARRFPQPVLVRDLIGLPMLDDDDNTIGTVRRVMRTADGRIVLIVDWHRLIGLGRLGIGNRPVAVPIEVVAIFGRQLASLDMPPEDYAAAPTFVQRDETEIPSTDTISIALTRR